MPNPEYSEAMHQKILGLIKDHDGPVRNTELHWEVDCGANESEFTELGPHPRRTALFAIIGNLVDQELVVMTTEGLLPK